MPPEVAAAFWKLGLLSSEDLPTLAMAWLEAGHSSHNAAVLAGEFNPSMSECAPLFEAALREIGAPALTLPESAWSVIHWTLSSIDNGKLDPVAGAEFLTLALHLNSRDIALFDRPDLDARRHAPNVRFAAEELGLEEVVGLYWVLDDDGFDRRTIALELRGEARRLLGGLFSTKPDFGGPQR
jgi:hypothetical protein